MFQYFQQVRFYRFSSMNFMMLLVIDYLSINSFRFFYNYSYKIT